MTYILPAVTGLALSLVVFPLRKEILSYHNIPPSNILPQLYECGQGGIIACLLDIENESSLVFTGYRARSIIDASHHYRVDPVSLGKGERWILLVRRIRGPFNDFFLGGSTHSEINLSFFVGSRENHVSDCEFRRLFNLIRCRRFVAKSRLAFCRFGQIVRAPLDVRGLESYHRADSSYLPVVREKCRKSQRKTAIMKRNGVQDLVEFNANRGSLGLGHLLIKRELLSGDSSECFRCSGLGFRCSRLYVKLGNGGGDALIDSCCASRKTIGGIIYSIGGSNDSVHLPSRAGIIGAGYQELKEGEGCDGDRKQQFYVSIGSFLQKLAPIIANAIFTSAFVCVGFSALVWLFLLSESGGRFYRIWILLSAASIACAVLVVHLGIILRLYGER